MIKIIFLIRSLEVGGAERQLCVLAKHLHEKGYSVKVAVFYENGLLESELLDSGVPVIGLQRKSRWDIIPFYFRLLNVMRRENPDILHSYLSVANIWAVLVNVFLPRTRVVWGVRASSLDLKQYNWQIWLTEYMEFLLSQIPNWIVCNSRAGFLHALEKGYPKNKMSVISNGIDTDHFFPDRSLGRRFRRQWDIKDKQKLIGMVARVDSMKDYPNFLRASALLLRDRQDVHFLCVGDGSEELIEKYKEMAVSLGLEHAVTWAGYQEDMQGVYNSLDILVSSSAYGEGFSNVIGEAMACGVPCVATNVGDAALLVEKIGELVPPNDPEALRGGMLNLLNLVSHQETFISDQLAETVSRKFGVEGLTSNTILLFEKLGASHN